MGRSILSRTLSGLRVLDLTRNLAGPYCSMLLGDLGADVVKIESLGGGDDTRSWRPPDWNGHSAAFLSANRNKRSIAVDLDSPEGREIVTELARRSDILVESFRPGSLRKRGLDFAALSTVNPRLVYCSISAYGSQGPKTNLPGYDPVLQAETGIMDITGYPDDRPARLGIGAIDLGTALWATIGIHAALTERARTGRGSHIEVSLYETATWWMSYHLIGYLASGVTPTRQGTGTPFIAPYETFPTADGELLVAAGNDRHFSVLCDQLGLPDLARLPEFLRNDNRVLNRARLRDLLEPAFLSRPAAEWEEVLRQHAVPCSRVRSVADLAADPQLDALGLLRQVSHPDIPGLRLVYPPVSVDHERAEVRHPPPALGEHTDAILGELGFSDEAAADLRERGIIM